MGCCGRSRAAFANNQGPQPADFLQSTPMTSLRFVQRRSIVVRGPVTGRRYEFRDGAYVRGIDTRDAADLLKSGYFEKAAG
jgi:hypothetical protein